jgi:hypothetical protein
VELLAGADNALFLLLIGGAVKGVSPFWNDAVCSLDYD